MLWIIIFTLFLLSYPPDVTSQPYDYPTATLSTAWINSVTANHSRSFSDNTTIRAILLRGVLGSRYACGFYCNGNCETYVFAIFIAQTNSGGGLVFAREGYPQVWSANRNNPVHINATLELTNRGDLVLRDADGTLAWSTGTSGRSVAGLNLTESGNLVLFNRQGSVLWQSFDHPTDVLVPGQSLLSWQNLTSSVSETNWTRGIFSLTVSTGGLGAYVGLDPPQIYYSSRIYVENAESGFARFQNGNLDVYIGDPNDPVDSLNGIQSNSSKYMKLMHDGHIRVFELRSGSGWTEAVDLLSGVLVDCEYPNVCGENGICSSGQCTCPVSNTSSASFRQINEREPNIGCSPIVQLTCNVTTNHSFVDLEDTTYFNLDSNFRGVDVNSCKEACLRNCSCIAAIFRYGLNSSDGQCYLPSRIFSLMTNDRTRTHYNSSIHMKFEISSPSVVASNPEAQIPPPSPSEQILPPNAQENNRSFLGPILGSTIGIFCIAVAIGFGVFFYQKKKNGELEEDYLDFVVGMPTRFSYEELVAATDNFKQKLGHGGFGSVFQGLLKDSTQIAVKCLNDIGHIKKSFLAEVETIGSIHHVNLVKLVGFCAEKSHRLLVYEYMCNGSLEKWIYRSTQEKKLDWCSRRKIILDVAKGLAYLHEDCRQKIIHLDIKPQNILLDQNFNAKLADFDLSKLIDRDQSQVVTTMRGTPGYLAPEWLGSVITEKVDVYSFGIVILEILCGRKNFEKSLPEEESHLLDYFMKKAEEEKWFDVVDKTIVGIQSGRAAVVEMMEIAAWCLQNDYTKRPSMSIVIKVLEGAIDVRKDLDFNIFIAHNLVSNTKETETKDETPLLPSVLSGPR